MAFGSLLNLWISVCSTALPRRSDSTSCWVFTYWAEALRASPKQRIVTVMQTLNVASIIIPRITHDGIIPPRRRTSVRVPISSIESSLTVGKVDPVRGITRCERMRLSTQYVFATLLKEHLPVRGSVFPAKRLKVPFFETRRACFKRTAIYLE